MFDWYITVYSQTSFHERLGSRTIRFTNKFSEHKASRMTYCVSSYELWSTVKWCQETEKRKRIPFQTIIFHFPTTFHLRRQLSWRCMCSFELLMMDGKKSLKHVERLTEINKLRYVASCWLYCRNFFCKFNNFYHFWYKVDEMYSGV